MRRIKKRIMALFLSLALLVTMLPMAEMQAEAATNNEITQTLTNLSHSLNGKYWNAGVDVSNSRDFAVTNTKCPGKVQATGCRSNVYKGSKQCAGFARWLGMYIFGSDPYGGAWKKYTSFSQAQLEPGDIIRTNEPHSGMVWKIEGNTVYVAECWGGSGCKINWGCWNGNRSKASMSYISAHLQHWYKHPGGSTSAPVTGNNPSNIYVGSSLAYPTGNLSLGQSFGIRGVVYSANRLTNVTGTIYNSTNGIVQQKTVNPNATSYDLKGAINNAMVFNNLSAGSYRFVVSAADSAGYSKNVIESNFTVGTIPMPIFSASDTEGGVMVSMSAAEGTIHYTLDGSNPTAASARYTGPFFVGSSVTVRAIAERNGNKSAINTQCVTVRKLTSPTIVPVLEEDSIKVGIEAESGAAIYYTTDGSVPRTTSARYTQPLQFKKSATVKAIAIKGGCANSDVAVKAIKAEKPSLPTAAVSGPDKVAAGDAVKITWDKQEFVQDYAVKLYQGNKVLEEQTVQGCVYAFTLPAAGEYQVTVSAHNFIGSSAESYPPVKVTAMEPLTVTFKDYDGKVISTQKVRYGYSVELPENPSRRGHEFKKWDTSAIYGAITENVVAKAEYSKRKYIVKFLDAEGNVYAPQQEVLFDESVKLPQEPTIDKIGYAFMGWRCTSSDEDSALDYEHVDSNMTLQAVFDWGNKDLPVVSAVTKALQKDSNSYEVDVSLTNWPESKTYCKLLISLKTSSGKMIKTITRDVILEAGKTTALEGIELISDKVATQVEVNVVGLEGQKTAGAYARTVSQKTVSYANAVWSEWSTQAPPAGTVSESKIMYRRRSKIYADSPSLSLSGWQQTGVTTDVSDWGPVCSTASYPGESNTLRITRTQTYYNYYHYCCNYYSGKNNVDSIIYGSGRHFYHTLTTSSPLRALSMGDMGGRQAYGGKGTCAGCSANYYAWFLANTVTTYYYQTRTITNVYHFSKWGDWSAYSDTPLSAGTDEEVEASNFYRYQIPMETPADKEDTAGKTHTEEGRLSGTSLDLNGKHANILVYRSTNTDPTESQLEYVGQTVIGENNTYSFAFIPKEEPNEAKSNFIVSLAIEGQTSLYNIDVIYADKVNYKVTFYGRDGKEISSCQVPSGGSADVPEAPQEEGYTFLGWDKDTTNVQSDRVITAKYKENEYTAVYVDFENNTAELMQLPHGAQLPSPAVEGAQGMRFLGWDKILDGTATAEENIILTARYEKEQYTVTFVDGEGKPVSKQTVTYGESAKMPEGVTAEGRTFLGWETDSCWWKVTGDMTVKPILVYAKTADTPLYQLENIGYGSILTISAAKGLDVYYAIDREEEEDFAETEEEQENGTGEVSDSGDSPEPKNDSEREPGGLSEEWQLYTEEIFLDRDVQIRFYAAGNKMNDSNMVDVSYEYDEWANPYIKTAKLNLENVQVQKGKTVQIPITLEKNPGIAAMNLEVSYDTSAFENVSFKSGIAAGANAEYSLEEESGKVTILWSGMEGQKRTGTFGTLTLTAKETAKDGKHPLGLSCIRENTYDADWMDVRLEISGGNIQIGKETSGGSQNGGGVGNTNKPKPKKPVPGKGSVLKKGKNSYKVTTKGSTVSFLKTTSTSSKITVPGDVTINGIKYKVTSISDKAFMGKKKLKTVVIGNYVTAIGNNAFANCKRLTTVTIGKNVKKIGKEAFKGCSKLGKITVKSSKLTSVGKNAFKGIKLSAKIKVPHSKLKKYKRLMKGKGQGKKVKII